MAPDRNDDTGQYTEEYSDESFFNAISNLEPATTSKVAERVGCSYDLAYRRLQNLHQEGTVSRAKVGGSFVWTVNE